MVSKAFKAIEMRKSEGKNTTREEAELEGFAKLEKQLINATVGDTIVWMSPPGSKKEGYGNWGFVYLGKISNENYIQMMALRVEEPRVLDYSLFFSALSNGSSSPLIEEDFIAWPLVLSNKNTQQLRSLTTEFFRQRDAQINQAFHQTMHELRPYIDKYLEIVQTGGSKAFEQQVFNMILNYSLELKSYFEDGGKSSVSLPFFRVFGQYAYRVPPLVGSCGSIGSSNDIFNPLSPLSSILNPESKTHWDYHNGNCVVCNKNNADVGPCNICKDCEKKFD